MSSHLPFVLTNTRAPPITPSADCPNKKAFQTQISPGLIGREMRYFAVIRIDKVDHFYAAFVKVRTIYS